MKEFFGFGGYQRPAEGYFSWQHLTFVSSLIVVMALLAIFLGLRNRTKSEKEKNRVLIVAAILIDSFELFKLCIQYFRGNAVSLLYDLPLFLCSIQLITLPLAAFSKGRVKQAALDFVFIFGLLGAILGTYAAGNNYSCYPVLSFDNVVSGITHTLAGFAALYIPCSNMVSMKKKNIGITFSILLTFCVLAYTANIILDYNYMFLMRGDGTPYDLLYNLVNGHPVWYPLLVVFLFLLYISLFYYIFFLTQKKQGNSDK